MIWQWIIAPILRAIGYRWREADQDYILSDAIDRRTGSIDAWTMVLVGIVLVSLPVVLIIVVVTT